MLYRKELEEALAHNRNCSIIWAHIGISRRVEIQNLVAIASELLDKLSHDVVRKVCRDNVLKLVK